MKKLLFFICLAVAVTASANFTLNKMSNSTKVKADQVTEKTMTPSRSNGLTFTAKSISTERVTRLDAPKYKAGSYSWDFEDFEQVADWYIIDLDGDGNNWGYMDTIFTAHSGKGLVFSESFSNETGTALTPDNWLVSPALTFPKGIELYARGQDPNWCSEVFCIMVAVGNPEELTTADFVPVSPDFTATEDYVRYSADLSAFEGQTGCFAIRHYHVTDQFILLVDDITLSDDVEVEHYPTNPTNVEVEPAANSAYVTWEDDNDEAWNLRWRPYVDLSGNPVNITLPYETYEAELENIAILDYDGDGDGWGLALSGNADNDVCFTSTSFSSTYGVQTPDNWLIMPLTKLQGVCEFRIWHRSNYPEKMQVMIGMADAIEGNTVYTDQFTTIAEYTTTTNNVSNAALQTIDLSSYNGELGYVIFRHTGTSDQWQLYLDDIFIGDHNAEVVEPAEWIYVPGLNETSHNIEGLAPETTYEVQVQTEGVNYWTDIVMFTTLAAEEEAPNLYILGEVNEQDWAANAGTLMDYNEEDNIYTATVEFDGRNSGYNYFSFTTELAENADGWDYIAPFRIGAASEGTTDFDVLDEYLGMPLDIVHGQNAFKIPGGQYNLTVDLDGMKIIIEKILPPYLRGDVDNNGEVKIGDVTALINYLLSGDASEINLQAADCDENGEIKIGDVTALINYLLSGSWE